MNLTATLPLKVDYYVSAFETAIEISQQHKDFFIYLYKSNGGYYIIDHLGVNHSDERLISTFKNGKKSL